MEQPPTQVNESHGPELPKTPPNKRRLRRRRRGSDNFVGPTWDYTCKWIKHPNWKDHKDCYLELPYEFSKQEGLLAGKPSPIGDPPKFNYPACLEKYPDGVSCGHPHCWVVTHGEVEPAQWSRRDGQRPFVDTAPLPPRGQGGERVLGAPIWSNVQSAPLGRGEQHPSGWRWGW